MKGITKKFNSIFKKLKNSENKITIKLEFAVDGNKKEYKFKGDNIDITVGRSTDSDVVIEHNSVSRTHARLWYEGGILWVEDLGSKNGTFVGNIKIDKKHKVSDEITVGWVKVKIRVLMDDEKNENSVNQITDEKNLSFLLITGIILITVGIGIIILALFHSFL